MKLESKNGGMMYSLKLTLVLMLIFLFTACAYQGKKEVSTEYRTSEKQCKQGQEVNNANIAVWIGETEERVWQVKRARSLTNEDLCRMPANKLARAFYRLDNPKRPDHPNDAAAFRAQQQSVNGIVKPSGLITAIAQRKDTLMRLQTMQLPPAAGIDKNFWMQLGPGNIGGRVRAIYIHPTDTDLIFIGSVGGGIWKSSNAGVSWAPVDDFMGNLSISSIVADPTTTGNTSTTVLYAGTGEGFYNGDALRGHGIFKSTDGGTTWNHLSSTDPSSDSDWYYVNRIAVNGSGVIIAVTRENGIFRSTDDGLTWSKRAPIVSGSNNLKYDIKYDPNNNNRAIVGGDQGNVFYTTDGGATWTYSNIVSLSGWPAGRTELIYSASTANLVYASVDNNSGEIYQSTDGGVNWSIVGTPAHLGSQGWYDNTIWVDPTNSNHVVVGGIDLYQSTNGGTNWTKISTWYYSPTSPHADHHLIIHDPDYDNSSNKRVYIANDGGIYKADDISSVNANSSSNGWTNLNNNLSITQFYGAAGRNGTPGSRIIGGTQDNGALIQDSGTDWLDRFGGDGGFSAVATHTTPGEYYYYGEYIYLQLHRSDNGSWASYIYNGLTDAETYNANFIAPFMIDPNSDDTLLAGGDQLWRTTNARGSVPLGWSGIKGSVGSNISQIAVAEGNPNIILVGHNNGEIYKTINGSSTSPIWTNIHIANGKNVLTLLIDKNNHNTFYAGWGGFVAGNLKKSTDSGANWTDISSSLPEAPMRSIERNPGKANFLYVGTEVGIYTSEDGGMNWFTTNDGPANVSVDKLFWYDEQTLVAATHGRGMFQINVNTSGTNTSFLPAIYHILFGN